ncbi:MAG: hypothetical protein EZS28_006224 [Streblomastix strix]|uniref:Uncharacterized protein n=1 Tax=Streblomastix strix TaxID=222440 RepID=A0A5J4WTM0_9EUKA|nr:MAG: hypothetical protein EZS28_006224 [Streblomastix strix]
MVWEVGADLGKKYSVSVIEFKRRMFLAYEFISGFLRPKFLNFAEFGISAIFCATSMAQFTSVCVKLFTEESDRCDEKEDCYYDLSEEDYDLSDDLIDREFCDCLYELSGDDSCNVSYESDYDIICYICIGGGGIGGKLYRESEDDEDEYDNCELSYDLFQSPPLFKVLIEIEESFDLIDYRDPVYLDCCESYVEKEGVSEQPDILVATEDTVTSDVCVLRDAFVLFDELSPDDCSDLGVVFVLSDLDE